jgi:hypothetical protein
MNVLQIYVVQDNLPLLVEILRHLEMMLKMGQRLAGPVFQFRVITTFGVALK